MKKFTFAGSVLILFFVTGFLIMGCKKEQVSSEAKIEATEATNINNSLSLVRSISGLITENAATEMQSEFLRLNPTAKTLKVGYSIKDVQNYLKIIATKYGSDSVFVAFGAYDKNTAHTPSQIGRTTIFFTGNKFKHTNRTSSSTKSLSDTPAEPEKDFLNAGALIP